MINNLQTLLNQNSTLQDAFNTFSTNLYNQMVTLGNVWLPDGNNVLSTIISQKTLNAYLLSNCYCYDVDILLNLWTLRENYLSLQLSISLSKLILENQGVLISVSQALQAAVNFGAVNVNQAQNNNVTANSTNDTTNSVNSSSVFNNMVTNFSSAMNVDVSNLAPSITLPVANVNSNQANDLSLNFSSENMRIYMEWIQNLDTKIYKCLDDVFGVYLVKVDVFSEDNEGFFF